MSNEVKTKRVELYVDLWPDWHLCGSPCVHGTSMPYANKAAGCKRVRVVVDLPEHVQTFPADAEVTGRVADTN